MAIEQIKLFALETEAATFIDLQTPSQIILVFVSLECVDELIPVHETLQNQPVQEWKAIYVVVDGDVEAVERWVRKTEVPVMWSGPRGRRCDA